MCNPRANHRSTLRTKPLEVTSIFLQRIYQLLFTRPLRIRIFGVDVDARAFLRSQIPRASAVETARRNLAASGGSPPISSLVPRIYINVFRYLRPSSARHICC